MAGGDVSRSLRGWLGLAAAAVIVVIVLSAVTLFLVVNGAIAFVGAFRGIVAALD